MGGVADQASRQLECTLVEDGLLTPAQVERATRIRARLEEPKPLEILIVELGWVSRARLEAALRRRRNQLPVEEILLDKGLLSAERLNAAREEALKSPGRSLGTLLVDMGAVSEHEYLQAYREKHDVAFVTSDFSLVDPALLNKVSLQYLSRHRVLPLSIEGGRLNVLVADPEDKQGVLSDLSRVYGCPVSVSVTTRVNIDETLATLARPREDFGDARPFGSIQYHRIVENVDGDTVTNIVDEMLLKGMREGASDIHVEPMASKLRVRFRIDGSLVHVSDYPIDYAPRIVSRIKVLAQADIAEHNAHQDGRIYVRSGDQEIDIRASFYVTVFGENVVLRILRKATALISLDEMGFSPAMLRTFVEDALEPASGIVLVTGPTGSGKTTTLYVAMDRINDESKKIITCEDPVEYVMEGITQCSVADRPGMNFVDSLRAIVRQDPDIILVGEIRDHESADMAIQSALTGHKVLTTFHTEDSVGAILRLSDMNIEAFLIASTVNAILAQRLVRRVCRSCVTDYTPSPREIRALGLLREELSAFQLVRGAGCDRCLQTGYRGRMGIYELLILTDPMRDAILERRPSHELRRLALETPCFLRLQEDGVVKALRGETTLSEVLENAPRAQEMRPLGRLMEMYG